MPALGADYGATGSFGKPALSNARRTLPEALEIAYRAVTKEDLICITGSFYLVGEAKKHIAAKQREAEAAAAAAAAE